MLKTIFHIDLRSKNDMRISNVSTANLIGKSYQQTFSINFIFNSRMYIMSAALANGSFQKILPVGLYFSRQQALYTDLFQCYKILYV